jgi:hypothetical protein
MTSCVSFPSWFKYTLEDFTRTGTAACKNKEVWNYISNIKDFSKIMHLLCSVVGEDEIFEGVGDTIEENFHKYKNIKSYFSKENISIFNKKFSGIYAYCKNRYLLKEVIEEDLKIINEVKNNIDKLNKKICQKNLDVVLTKLLGFDSAKENLNFAIKCGEEWKANYRVADTDKVEMPSEPMANTVVNLFPKTFEYVTENKLGWHLYGWSGGY